MNTSYIKFLGASMLLALASVGAQAQEVKIGYVNRDRVMSETTLFKAADAKFKAEFAKREKDLQDLDTKLKAAAERMDKDAPTLTEAERGRRQRDLVEQDREFQRKRRAFQEDVAQRQQEEIAVLFERASKVIKQIFETEKYDLIIQEAVFAGPRVDITEKVIKALNAQTGK
jgi:outer membrane protein